MFNNEMAEKLKLLSDKSRLTIMGLLKDKEWCVCDLVDILNMSQPSVSQHLRKLKAQGLVKETKRAQWVYYTLDIEEDSYIQTILNTLPDTESLVFLLKGEYTPCDCK